jgi:hypothetical protein
VIRFVYPTMKLIESTLAFHERGVRARETFRDIHDGRPSQALADQANDGRAAACERAD